MTGYAERYPLPPVDAVRTNLTCHFCIVGCGYHVYRWPVGSEGGPAPQQNALALDFRHQAPAFAGTPAPSMFNVVSNADGRRYHILVVPDKECVVNRGLFSTRGGQLGEVMYSRYGATTNRLQRPSKQYDSQWLGTSWGDAFDIYARVAIRSMESGGPDTLLFNCFDHGGAGGGFENTWGTGKLMFSAIGTKMVRIHNRPAYNSECHASRDMGISELNNSYLDAQLADTLLVAGANPYETQTNYFLAHWLPNLRGETTALKRVRFPDEAHAPARIIIVDPRRTATVAICEEVVGKENCLHLDIEPGTDMALFNGLLTYVIDRGWHDVTFIAKHTTGFSEAREANRISLAECSRITGIEETRLKTAAEWAYGPKDGDRRRTLHAYEKGVIWGNDNYRTQAALVNLAIATRNVGRRGTGVVRLGGHQEGYARPPYPGPRPAPNIDRAVMDGEGRMFTVWGTNPFQSTANAKNFKASVIERSQIVRSAIRNARGADVDELVEAIHAATSNGGLFVTVVDIYPTATAEAAHLLLPAAQPGEMNLTSMNGERRMRLTERFMDPPGDALPDCLIAAGIANRIGELYREAGDLTSAERYSGFNWNNEEDAFNDGFRNPSGIDSQGGASGHLVTYERLRAAGNNGVQLPVREYRDGNFIGTEMLYQDGRFDTADGRARFLPAPWKGLLTEAAEQKRKYPFWLNNGRVNHIWQTAYHDRYLPYREGRFPLPPLEISLEDAKRQGISAGDVVELQNDYGTAIALAYPEPSAKLGQLFMEFTHFRGVMGNLATDAVDENVVPYYKGSWVNIKRIGRVEDYVSNNTFKSRRLT